MFFLREETSRSRIVSRGGVGGGEVGVLLFSHMGNILSMYSSRVLSRNKILASMSDIYI